MAKKMTAVETLRRAIRDSGLTHYRIGKDAGVKPDKVALFVAGKRDLRLSTAARIIDALGLELKPRTR